MADVSKEAEHGQAVAPVKIGKLLIGGHAGKLQHKDPGIIKKASPEGEADGTGKCPDVKSQTSKHKSKKSYRKPWRFRRPSEDLQTEHSASFSWDVAKGSINRTENLWLAGTQRRRGRPRTTQN